jgi:hypothetical protein
VFVVGPLSPAVGSWVVGELPSLPYYQTWARYFEGLGRRLTDNATALLVVYAVAAGLALLCYRRLARYGAGRAERVVWPAFVFLLGLPGWVGFRFARPWPVREPCPACGAAAPRDRTACAACGAEFPPPSLKGTEVFA